MSYQKRIKFTLAKNRMGAARATGREKLGVVAKMGIKFHLCKIIISSREGLYDVYVLIL
jgi:hypothetical protein